MKNSMHILKHVLLGALAIQLLNSTQAAAPVVNWLRPTNGQAFAAGSGILLRASATDSNSTLSVLDFVAGTNPVWRFFRFLTHGIFNATWSNAPTGNVQ